MPVVRLVCWKQELAEERAQFLQAAGIDVDASPLRPHGLIAQFREAALAAVIIDLDRLPSHGREVAVALRWAGCGVHASQGAWGAASGREILVAGSSHYVLRNGRIVRDQTVFDELAVLRQVLGGLGADLPGATQ